MFDDSNVDFDLVNASTVPDTTDSASHADLEPIDLPAAYATTVIESLGSTTLSQVADSYSVGGQTVMFFGSPFAPGQLGAWAPVAAEAVDVRRMSAPAAGRRRHRHRRTG